MQRSSIFKLALKPRGILVAWLVCCLGCQRAPSDESIRKDFLAEHPACSIVSIGDVSGDARQSEVPIRYKKPDEERIFTDIWHYESKDGRSWRLVQKQAQVETKSK